MANKNLKFDSPSFSSTSFFRNVFPVLLDKFLDNFLLNLHPSSQLIRIQFDRFHGPSIWINEGDLLFPRLQQISDDCVVPIFLQCGLSFLKQKAVISFQLKIINHFEMKIIGMNNLE